MSFLVEPSLLSSDFSKLGEEIQAVEKAGADGIHLDIMDSHFVPNLTFGPPIVQSLRALSSLPFEAHLMLSRPETLVDAFALAGVDRLVFHLEAVPQPLGLLRKIKNLGIKAGLSIKPESPVENLFPFLKDLDFILIMTVEPGKSGQSFLREQAKKVEILSEEICNLEKAPGIVVDGGINPDTTKYVQKADILVSGDYIFKSPDYTDSIAKLKNSK